MLKKLVIPVTVSLLVGGAVLIASGPSGRDPQSVPARPVSVQPDRPAPSPLFADDASAGEAMAAFDRRARVDMLLYRGRFGEGDLAATRRPLDAVALTVAQPAR
jgi:hypothetical protein